MVQAFSFWPCFALPHPACIMNYAANHFQHCDKHVAVVRHGRSYCEHVFISSAMQTVKRCPAWINMLKQEQSVLGESFSSGLLSPTQCLGMSVSSVRTIVTFQSLGFFFFRALYILESGLKGTKDSTSTGGCPQRHTRKQIPPCRSSL